MSGKGKKPPSMSDRVGGPSTIRGVNYQIHFAILKALEMIGLAKNLPHRRFSVELEPRFLGDTITAWDVQYSPPDVLAEVKLAPTRLDVLEWLARTRKADYQGAFQLVCGKKRGGLLPDVEALVRLTHEASGDGHKFETLVGAQPIENADEIFETLDPTVSGFFDASASKLFLRKRFGGKSISWRPIWREAELVA